jgi:parvulin-like peptidyl-prolyl isomerase
MPPRLKLLCVYACFAFASQAFPTILGPLLAQVPTRADVDEAKNTELPDDPAAIIAVVNRSPILLGELTPKVEARIREVVAKTNQEIPADQLHFARLNLTRGLLSQAIQNKMMRESFLIDQVGTEAADKHAEADAKLATKARQMFFESEVPQLKKQYEVTDLTKLDKLLRQKGSSLAARQRDFVDAMLGHLYIRSKVDREPNVSVAEVNEYYYANLEQYERPARAKWEQMSVLFQKFDTPEAAHKAIWDMGREAYFGGSMEAVAREKSQEPFAAKGGLHDWTAKGSLASDELDKQIFSLPLNVMSDIVKDETGYHIIRVLERNQAGNTPLSEVQDDIRATVRQDKIAQSQKKVMDEMMVRIPVWSLFPDDTPGAKPLPASIARRAAAKKTR